MPRFFPNLAVAAGLGCGLVHGYKRLRRLAPGAENDDRQSGDDQGMAGGERGPAKRSLQFGRDQPDQGNAQESGHGAADPVGLFFANYPVHRSNVT